MGPGACKLDLPLTSKIHPVFYVSYLKKKVGQQHCPLPSLPLVDQGSCVQLEPNQIFDKRMKRLGNHAISELLIKWLGASNENNSWESLWKLRNQYPHLEGSVLTHNNPGVVVFSLSR